MRSLTLLAAALATVAAAAPETARAQLNAPVVAVEARSLSAAERASTVDQILAALDGQYVFPERVPAMREALRAALAAGRYDGTDSVAFAERLTEDLRRSSNDGHMYVRYDPEQFAAAQGADEEGDAAELDALWAGRFRRMNYGLTEQRVLPGNVRYLKISLFGWVNDETGGVYDSAMRFLAGGDAVIIDLRGNGGGVHDAVRYGLSHFMKPDALLVTFLEAGKAPEPSRTLTHLPAGRMVGKPLYVLIDGRVGSAGEEFAYSVQQFKLGTLIGQTTAGGANNNRFVPIGPGFMLSVSYGLPQHPVTGGNWEGVGVEPDVETSADEAMERAQALAREALAASAP